MSAGNFYIRKNSSDVTALVQAGFFASWDSLVKDEGSIVAYTNPNLQLDTGIYLIQYSEMFEDPSETTDSTNRIEIQGEIFAGGVSVGGYSQEYLRLDTGDFEGMVNGQMILEVTADNTDIKIKFYRTDDSTKSILRVPGYGGISILQLDDSDDYGLYSTSAQDTTTGTTVKQLALNTNDREDTGFSRTSAVVTLSTAGRYLMMYSMDMQATSGRDNASAHLKRNGTTPVVGSYAYTYFRSTDSTLDGALTWIGVVDVVANDTFEISYYAPASTTLTVTAGASLQMWKLPSAADTIIIEATTGNYNTNAKFTWDTTKQIDTASFTHTAATDNFTVDQDDHLLVFGSFKNSVIATSMRSVPLAQVMIDGDIRNTAGATCYDRASGAALAALNVTGLFNSVQVGSEVSINTTMLAASGVMANDSGQLSAISLESIWDYTYVFPPKIATAPTQLDAGDTNKIITGSTFEASQGTGKVEISDNAIYGSGTVVTQTIDTWSDTSIQFDFVSTGLSEGRLYIFVTNDSGGYSDGEAVNYGELTPLAIVQALDPDIFHTFDNTYDDDGMRGGNNPVGSTVAGSYSFKDRVGVRGTSKSWSCDDDVSKMEVADSEYTNVTTLREIRYVGGWIRLARVYLAPTGFYEEGGGVNNLYMIVGYGNVLLANMADSNNGTKIQAFSDIKLSSDRWYHAMLFYQGSNYTAEFGLYLDGVKQAKTDGNPILVTTLALHSGDWTYGKPDGTLDTGGTDIQYPSGEDLDIQYFGTWSDAGSETPLSTDTIRTELVAKCAQQLESIATNTEANMQTAADLLADDVFLDTCLAIKVYRTTGGGDLELTFDNIEFKERVSIPVLWMGTSGETLTIIDTKGTIDSSKCESPYGGDITIVVPYTLTLSGMHDTSKIVILDASDDSVIGSTESSSGSFALSVQASSVHIMIIADSYVTIQYYDIAVTGDATIPIVQEADYAYKNP